MSNITMRRVTTLTRPINGNRAQLSTVFHTTQHVTAPMKETPVCVTIGEALPVGSGQIIGGNN